MHYGAKHGWVHKIPCPSQSQSSALLLGIHSNQISAHNLPFKLVGSNLL